MPGYQSRMTGKWVPGCERVGKKAERGNLDWSPWEPVTDRTKAILPNEHGVLRIRVAR